jgi:hypothetical protein
MSRSPGSQPWEQELFDRQPCVHREPVDGNGRTKPRLFLTSCVGDTRLFSTSCLGDTAGAGGPREDLEHRAGGRGGPGEDVQRAQPADDDGQHGPRRVRDLHVGPQQVANTTIQRSAGLGMMAPRAAGLRVCSEPQQAAAPPAAVHGPAVQQAGGGLRVLSAVLARGVGPAGSSHTLRVRVDCSDPFVLANLNQPFSGLRRQASALSDAGEGGLPGFGGPAATTPKGAAPVTTPPAASPATTSTTYASPARGAAPSQSSAARFARQAAAP